ncbi:MAG: hypothetical protein Q8P01_01880 [bacterium]|nr:hypothetical protein [bacterium]
MENPQQLKGINKSWIKIGILGVLGISASVATVEFAARFLENLRGGDVGLSIVAGVLFLIIVALQAIFVEKTGIIFLIAILQAFAPLAVFIPNMRGAALAVLMGGAFVFFVFLCEAMRRGRAMVKNGVRIKFFPIGKAVIPKTATGLFVFVSILFYLSYFVWGHFNEETGKRLSNELLKSTDPIIGVMVPGAGTSQTVDEFLAKIAELQIRKLKTQSATERVIEFDLDLLTPEERKLAMEGIVEEIKKQAEGAIGPLRGDEVVRDAVWRIGKSRLEKLLENVSNLGTFIGIAAGLLVFGFLKSFAFLSMWLVELLAFLVYKFLIATGFAKIETKPVNQESITI